MRVLFAGSPEVALPSLQALLSSAVVLVIEPPITWLWLVLLLLLLLLLLIIIWPYYLINVITLQLSGTGFILAESPNHLSATGSGCVAVCQLQ